MNKRSIALVTIGVLVASAAIFGILEFASYKSITFESSEQNVSVKISNSTNGDEIKTVSLDEPVKLKEGSYMYSVTNEGFDNSSVSFNVSKDATITVKTSYSTEKLHSLLEEVRTSIHEVILGEYPFVNKDYIFGDESLHNKGEWYSAKLIQRVSGGNQPDIYRVIVHKENKVWTISTQPALSISIESNKSIPEDIIRQVNKPLSNSGYDLLYPL